MVVFKWRHAINCLSSFSVQRLLYSKNPWPPCVPRFHLFYTKLSFSNNAFDLAYPDFIYSIQNYLSRTTYIFFTGRWHRYFWSNVHVAREAGGCSGGLLLRLGRVSRQIINRDNKKVIKTWSKWCKGSSINDVTQFWYCLALLPLCHAFSLSTVVAKLLGRFPKIVTSFIDDPYL